MIIVDTGPIVAAAVTTEVDHHACTELFGGLHLAQRRLVLSATVVSEVGHLLGRDLGTYAEARFIRSIAGGDFQLVNLEPEDIDRMAELVAQYEDSKLDTTDASVIAIAERLNISEVATLNRRHFSIVRPRHIAAFTLLPERV